MAAFASSVMLGDLNDFITPAQSCVNPIFAEAANATPPDAAAGADAEAAKNGTGPKIQLSFDNTAIFRQEDATAPTTAAASSELPQISSSNNNNNNPFAAKAGLLAPNLIKATGEGEKKIAKVSLSDCLACSGCVTSAETVLIQQQSVEQVKRALSSGDHAVFVASVSSAARTALAVKKGWELTDVLPKLRQLLRAHGVHFVLDAQIGSNLALLEIRRELESRLDSSVQGSGGDSGTPKIPHKWTRPLATVALNQDEDRTVPTLASGEESRVIPVVHSSNATTTSNLEGAQKRVPLLTSSCPGWICFVEKTHPEAIPYLSTAKSPQQVMGSLIKSRAVLSDASETTSPQVEPLDAATSSPPLAAVSDVPAVRSKGGVYHLTIMPCPDKKLEASRKDFEAKLDGGDSGSGSGSADVDCVLTTNELLSWLDETDDANTDTDAAAPAAAASTHPDNVSATQRLSALDEWLSQSPPHAPSQYRSGSSGLLEYVFRTLARERFGVELDPRSPLPYKQVRNRDFQTVALAVDNKTVLNCAAVYGFRNIQSVIRQLKRGKCPYDFVEVMACPGGCLNGGGQPQAAPPVAEADDTDAVEPGAIATQRAKDAYLAQVVKKHESLPVQAAENDAVAQRVKDEWLEDEVLRHKVLHTRYHAVPQMESGLGQSW